MEEDEIRCSQCNEVMSEGYKVHDGLYHYCSNECLYTVMNEKEYLELHEEGDAFWTTFED